METELDKRQELIEKIKKLSAPEDVQKVKRCAEGKNLYRRAGSGEGSEGSTGKTLMDVGKTVLY